VVFEEGEIQVYDKKQCRPEMRHIDWGLSLFKAEAFQGQALETKFDLAELMSDLLARGQLAGFEVRDRFYEIGSHAGLAELDALLVSKPPPPPRGSG